MVSIFKKSLFALCFVFASFAIISARTVSECKVKLREVAQSLVDQNVYNYKINSIISASSSFTEEELIELCDQLLFYRKELGLKANNVEIIKDELISYLRSFVATSMDFFEVDPNFAFIYDEQNPNFTVTFGNMTGEVKTRKYALKIWSIGLKFEVAIKIDVITIIGAGFNYYDTNKTLKLGNGIDLSVTAAGGLGVTYAKIEEIGNCGVLIIGLMPIGVGGALSYVFGGEMTPINK